MRCSGSQRLGCICSYSHMYNAASQPSWERRQTGSQCVNHHAKTFLLLSKEPVREKLIRYGLEEVRVHIGKNLSYEEEQIYRNPSQLKKIQRDFVWYIWKIHIQYSGPADIIKDEAFIRGKVYDKRGSEKIWSSVKALSQRCRFYDVPLKRPVRMAVSAFTPLRKIRRL